MVNPPASSKKGTAAACKANKANARNASSTSKTKRAATDENTDAAPAKRQNTGTNGCQPRNPNVLGTANNGNDAPGEVEPVPDGSEILRKYNEMKAKYEEEKTARAALEEKLESTEVRGGTQGDKDLVNSIPKPPGTAGKDYSVQIEMGLAGSAKKTEKYKAIQRNLRDLCLNARIDWESPWKQIPLRDRANLCEIARSRMPFLERFTNDWAIEDLVKQFMKNRRSNHYRKGWLEVPAKYGHLKANAQKRDKNGSHVKKALSAPVTSSRARNRPSTNAEQWVAGIRVAGTRVVEDEDEDDLYGIDGERGSDGGEDDEEEE